MTEMYMMFTHRSSAVKKTAKAIQQMLDAGWRLVSINEDKVYFDRDEKVQQVSQPMD